MPARPFTHTTTVRLLTLGAVLMACHAQAQELSDSTLPLWEMGVFGSALSQQAYPGSSQQIGRALALPYVIYRGKYFRADRGSVGVRAVKTDALELDVGFGGAFGSTSKEVDARNGMPDLGTLVEFGPRIKWNLGAAPGNGRWRAEMALRGVFDLTDQFKDRGFSLEPELIYERRSSSGWGYGTSVGLVFGDQRLNDTFYGVAPAYATASRPAYRAKDGLLMASWSLNVSRSINPDWRIFGFARLATVEGAANTASPLMRQTTASNVGLAMTYTFARSADRAVD